VNLKTTLRRLAPRSIRAHRILGGQLRGRIIVTSIHDYPAAILGRTEEPLLSWFRNNVKAGETWLDVGAHYGYTTIALAELVGASGRVYAFEPSLTTAGHLNQTRRLNAFEHVTVLPFALGEPGAFRLASVEIERGMANHSLGGATTEPICVIAFDDLWNALGQRPIHGVKIDVQGMELQVIEGMLKALTLNRPKLVVEFHSGVDRNRIIEVLRTAGYLHPAVPLEPLPAESVPAYRNDRSYVFDSRAPA
jgi:FkbM family methyltransferase